MMRGDLSPSSAWKGRSLSESEATCARICQLKCPAAPLRYLNEVEPPLVGTPQAQLEASCAQALYTV
jgi:hypothetical protein